MNVLTVIPARGKSERVQNKNLYEVLGKPLIVYTIEMAKKSALTDVLCVSTDSVEIAQVSRRYEVEIINRPQEIATATSAIDDAVRHALRTMEENRQCRFDIVVLLQANVPVRKEGEIDEAVRMLKEDKNYSTVATGYEVSQRPEWMKRVRKDTGIIEAVSPGEELYRMQDLEPFYLLDGAVIALRRDVLLKTEGDRRVHAYMGDNVAILIHQEKYATEIDRQEDFALAEFYLRNDEV